jgi:MFS family permease
VFALIFAGFVAAFQVGKAAIAVPLLRHDLDLSLDAASWILGAFGTLGAIAGFPIGILVSRLDPRKAVVGGLLAIGAGNILGAMSPTQVQLLASRALEGSGFLITVVAIPTMLRIVSAPRDRDFVFSCWTTYMPGGTALMMLAGPILNPLGWQGLWLVNGCLAFLYAAFVTAILARNTSSITAASSANTKIAIAGVLRSPGPIVLALCFTVYAIQYYAMTGLFPALLVERLGLSVAAAGAISAATVVANAAGNLAAGALMRWKVPFWATIVTAFIVTGIAALGIFGGDFPAVVVAMLAALSLAISGLIPASVFAGMPRLVASPHMIAVAFGLLVQASNLGQLLGPPALGSFVERFGWSSASLVFLLTALVGAILAVSLRPLLR